MTIDYNLLNSRNHYTHTFEWTLRDFLINLNSGIFNFLVGPTTIECSQEEIIGFITSVVFGYQPINICITRNSNGTSTVLKGYKECVMLMLYANNLLPKEDKIVIDLKSIVGEKHSFTHLLQNSLRDNESLVNANDEYTKFSPNKNISYSNLIKDDVGLFDRVNAYSIRCVSMEEVTKRDIMDLMSIFDNKRSKLEILCTSILTQDFLNLVEHLRVEHTTEEILNQLQTLANSCNMNLEDYCINYKGENIIIQTPLAVRCPENAGVENLFGLIEYDVLKQE